MNRLSLHYPVFPHVLNRGWGVADSVYEQFGFTCHNGVDLAPVEGQDIRAPFDGVVTLVGILPKGSGTFVSMVSSVPYTFDDGKTAKVELTFMHLKEAKVEEGANVRAGDLIALGGKSGQASAPHVHMAPKRVKRGWFGYRDLDRNGAGGTFDPEQYWSKQYAKRDA